MNAEIAAVSAAVEKERSLVARAASGDQAAARVLYDAHAQRVYRLAYRMCGDADLAADVTQDVFVRVFAQLAKFRGESAFTTWLHRVAVTTCLNTLRKVKRFRQREVEMDEACDQPLDQGSIEPALRQALATAIDALPDDLRIVLVMHAFEGYTHVEIGNALGIPEGTSKSRLFEAKGRLRESL